MTQLRLPLGLGSKDLRLSTNKGKGDKNCVYFLDIINV